MVAALLVPMLLVQAARSEIKASVDRDHLAVGDDLVYSVQAISPSVASLRILVPAIAGFEIIGRSERSSVSHLGGTGRSTTLELRLRALKPGKWTIGPARAVQGGEEVVAPAVTVRVDDVPGATAIAANPALRALLERAPQGEGLRCYKGRVRFERVFQAPPVVQIGITGFDIDNGDNARLNVGIVDVDGEGFDVELRTWWNSRLWSVDLNWIAIGH